MVDHILEQICSGLRVTALDLLEQIDKRCRKIHRILQLLLGELQRATGIVTGDLGGEVSYLRESGPLDRRRQTRLDVGQSGGKEGKSQLGVGVADDTSHPGALLAQPGRHRKVFQRAAG